MVNRPTPRSDTQAQPSQYILRRPLPLLELSAISLTADELMAIRNIRLAWMCDLHRSELKRLGNLVRQAKRRALLEKDDKNEASQLAVVQKLRKSVGILAKRYEQRRAYADTWAPSCSCPDDHGGVSLDPEQLHTLGSKLDGYLQHIPSLFSVEWASDGGLTKTLPGSSHRLLRLLAVFWPSQRKEHFILSLLGFY